MPLIKEINETHYKLALWQATEPVDFFLEALCPEIALQHIAHISNPKKQVEFLSSRYLIQHTAGKIYLANLKKQPNGKPYFKNLKSTVSISHSATHSAILISENSRCGIDTETIHPRVKRIASRFLSEAEIGFLNNDTETEMLTLFWSAKETVFKWYSEGNIEFNSQILLQPDFILDEKGQLHYKLILPKTTFDIQVNYERVGAQILTYAV